MKIEHISVSRKRCFDQCQMQYRYRYHLEMVGKPQDEPMHFTYGTIVHKIAEEYVKSRGEKLLSEVAGDVLTGRIDIDEGGRKAPPLPQEYKRKLPLHLKALKNLTDKTGFIGEVEYPFYYDLDPPNKRFVKGYIDRVIIQDDKYWIIDYKTTKQAYQKNSSNILDDLQLKCYARIIQKNFNAKPENIKTALYYLEGPKLIGACFSAESLERVEQELLQSYLEIENTPEFQAYGRVGNWCRFCDYRKICPVYSLT